MKACYQTQGKQRYDLIGDVHGYADELKILLRRLGYKKRRGCFRHTTRKAIFLGDLIDRGPQIPEALRIVRDMVQEGEALAVMGNHEYNAIRFHAKGPNGFLRRHTAKNLNQHRATLQAFAGRTAEWTDYLRWFQGLPLFIDLEDVRVVHACWCEDAIKVLGGCNALTEEIVGGYTKTARVRRAAVEMLLRGKEIRLPQGHCFTDKDGTPRSIIRVRWWLAGKRRTYRELAIPGANTVPNLRIKREIESSLAGYSNSAPPIMIGHYCLSHPEIEPLATNIACLDYGVIAGGPLVAYRWNGERVLTRRNFVTSRTEKETY